MQDAAYEDMEPLQLVIAFRFLCCHAKRLERHFKSLKGQRIEQLELDLAYGDMKKASRAYYQVKDLCALRSIDPYDANEYPEVWAYNEPE